MRLSRLTVRNFRQFGDGNSALHLSISSGLTALVGRNDSGKSTIIDAIRYALLTRDQEYFRVQPADFHLDKEGRQATDIAICCKLTELNDDEKGAFVEYLSYEGQDVSLIINWTAARLSESPSARRWVDVTVRSGLDGSGPTLESSVRELLSTAYLRPLRDAEREMSAGRGSRLSQILANVPAIKDGNSFDASVLPEDAAAVASLGIVGLTDYLRYSVRQHKGVSGAEQAINDQYLSSLSLSGDRLLGRIDITEGGTEKARLRQMLERLELALLESSSGTARGRFGLGSNNLLYMACELLLLGYEPEGLPLLLVEEPEAHLHPQRQLRLVEFLMRAASAKTEDSRRPVQVILTTHSPNLASRIPLESLLLLDGGRAFPLADGYTRLDPSDYRFLERFLDVTKANLFFAHAVIVVEGDAEAILLPVIAKLMGHDLTEHGVSVVNVGSTGLRRFSRIFQRSDSAATPLSVPIACIADMDVMPDCAPVILGLVENNDDPRWTSPRRRWKARRDFIAGDLNQDQLLATRRERLAADDGQSVRTFVADHWTLEYDLAYCGMPEDVHLAAWLAKHDGTGKAGKEERAEIESLARADYAELLAAAQGDLAVLCTRIYQPFHSGHASKAVGAQYLAELLLAAHDKLTFDRASFTANLPRYIVDAITHVVDPTREHLSPNPAE